MTAHAERSRGFDLHFGPRGRWRGVLAEDDPSLTYDAERREVRSHPGGEVVGDDVFTALGAVLDGDPETLWVGWFGYAARGDLPARPAGHGVPDAAWMRVRLPAEDDAVAKAPTVTATAPAAPSAAPAWYRAAFDEVQRQLRAGNTYEVNLTHRLLLEGIDDADAAYARLCAANPAPYAGHVWHHGTHLVSSSPERFATVRDRHAVTSPIKGTTPRGATAEEDARWRERLLRDPKIRAENLIVTDLLRNDLAIACRPGSVHVSGLMEVRSYAHVHQLVTTVEGDLEAGTSTLDLLRALSPAGSMTGAPKRRTMEVIDGVERSPRGIYSGSFGWICGDGSADLAVVIRSLVRDPGGRWSVGTGGGITVHSDPEEEWKESEWKVSHLCAAVGARPGSRGDDPGDGSGCAD